MYSRGSGFGPPLTPMIKRIIIACAAVWVAQLLPPTREMLIGHGMLSAEQVLDGQVWQPFTYMWLHDWRGPMHILFNLFVLWMFGSTLEQLWGSRRFLNFYLTCGIGAGFLIFIWDLITPGESYTLGASGAIYGVLTAFALMWPNRQIVLLFPPIPIKAIWFIPILFFMNLFFGGGSISHVGHLGGVLVAGYLMREYLGQVVSLRSLRYRWHRYRMRNRLRAVRREEWERRQRRSDDDRPTYH